MENVHLVTSWDHVADADLAAPVGNCIVRSIQRDHHGAHLSVNVAEDERDSRLVEFHKLRGATLIKSKVKALAVEQRKDIVEKGIPVGELDRAPRWDHQQRRLETLILLHQLGDWCGLRRWRGYWSGPQRREPNHNLRSSIHRVPVSRELHLALEFDILCCRKPRDKRHQQDAPEHPAMSEANHVQNSIPMERLSWLVTLPL